MAFQFDVKKAGDLIKSTDWNDLNTETTRLGNDKVDRAGDTIKGDLTVTGKVNVSGPLSVTGTSTLTGNTSVGGTLNVSGVSTLTGNTNVGGTLSVTGASTFNNAVSITGNVGIGTATPKGFQVVLPERSKERPPSPGITMAGGLDGNASIELRNNGSGTPYIDFSIQTGVDYDGRIRLTAPGQLAIEGANVGIGTATPGAKLEVRGGLTILEQEAWKDAPLVNGWANYGYEYNPPQYCKDSLGVVHLRGLIKDGAIGYTVPAFTLPPGYRPASKQLHVVMTNPNVAGRVDIDNSGNVCVGAGDKGWVSLDSISFRVA